MWIGDDHRVAGPESTVLSTHSSEPPRSRPAYMYCRGLAFSSHSSSSRKHPTLFVPLPYSWNGFHDAVGVHQETPGWRPIYTDICTGNQRRTEDVCPGCPSVSIATDRARSLCAVRFAGVYALYSPSATISGILVIANPLDGCTPTTLPVGLNPKSPFVLLTRLDSSSGCSPLEQVCSSCR